MDKASRDRKRFRRESARRAPKKAMSNHCPGCGRKVSRLGCPYCKPTMANMIEDVTAREIPGIDAVTRQGIRELFGALLRRRSGV